VSFESFLDEARDDANVLGVVLVGSRGKGAQVTDASDVDAWVVVGDPGRFGRHSRHGDPVEYIVASLESFRRYALPGEPSRWDAYSFSHVEPLIDKLDGEIARLVREKAVAAPGAAADFLDGYVNLYYRSAKNHAAGRAVEAHLDAAESMPWLLDFVFAAEGRVRPFNKWLLWELEHHPLDAHWDGLVDAIARVVADGDLADQQALFRRVEEYARAHGFADVVDGWEPDVAFLRG
jgi:predicted nucleotidyltransferase